MENNMKLIQTILNKNTHLFTDVEIQQDEANTDKFLKLKIIEVLTSNGITAELYNKVSHKEIRVIPDLVITLDSGYYFFEIKTSKKNNGVLPGSSIQQINLLEPTIFWNRELNEFKVNYYYVFLTGELPFPDRSPRPTVRYHGNGLSLAEAHIVIDNWKDYLADIWLQKLQTDNNKWFDEAIDIFVLRLLNLSKEEQEELIKIIKARK